MSACQRDWGPHETLGDQLWRLQERGPGCVGKKLEGTWFGGLGLWLVLLLGTEIRRCWEFTQNGRIPPPSSRAWC